MKQLGLKDVTSRQFYQDSPARHFLGLKDVEGGHLAQPDNADTASGDNEPKEELAATCCCSGENGIGIHLPYSAPLFFIHYRSSIALGRAGSNSVFLIAYLDCLHTPCPNFLQEYANYFAAAE